MVLSFFCAHNPKTRSSHGIPEPSRFLFLFPFKCLIDQDCVTHFLLLVLRVYFLHILFYRCGLPLRFLFRFLLSFHFAIISVWVLFSNFISAFIHRLTSSLYSSLCFYSFKLYLHLLEYADCLTILIIILLNSSVGFFFQVISIGSWSRRLVSVFIVSVSSVGFACLDLVHGFFISFLTFFCFVFTSHL